MRVVNVVDLMRLQPRASTRTGCRTREFDALFTADKPVIFAYHGYPWLIHRLTYRRTNHDNLHVRGYKEEGTTTTPFDMVVLNDMDRYHLVMDVIDRVPGLATRAAVVRQQMVDKRARAPPLRARARRGHAGGARLDVAAVMRVLVVNAGSSSLKLSVLDDADEIVEQHDLEDWDGDASVLGDAGRLLGLRRRRPPGRARGCGAHRAGRR